ncbi:MAG TPA: ABC transporter ATP-binding protein [Caulobacteraceae bacterium]
MLVLEAAGLTKAYGEVKALDDFSLAVPRGGVYGVLGPNGAGKSTLFRVWLGLVRASAGRASVLGGAPGEPRRIGSMIETPRFWPFMSAMQVLSTLALAGGLNIGRDELMARLARVDLADAANRKVRGYSVGMLQRLGVAAALLGEPELVILDEPTSGMDPVGIQEMRGLIRSLADVDGVTVVLASHQLPEVQRICDRVAIMSHGRLSAEGSVAELISGRERLRLTATPVDQVVSVLGAKAMADGDAVLADIPRAEASALIAALVGHGVAITEARWVGGDLEQVFMQQTGGAPTKEARDAG